MINCTVDIPGTDLKIGLIEFDHKAKTAKFILIKKPLGSIVAAKHVSNIKEGKKLEIISDYYVFIENTKENQLTLVIGKKSDEFEISDGDLNVLGYAQAHVNTYLPEHLVLADEAINFRKPYHPLFRDLANTYYRLLYNNKEKTVLLYYENKRSDDLEPFDPHKNPEKFVIADKISKSNWASGKPEKGIKFDATGTGDVDSPYNYAVYNDFFISGLQLWPQFAIFPVMAIEVTVGKAFNLKGMEYYPTTLERKSIKLIPVLLRTLIAAFSTSDISKGIEKTAEQERAKEIIQLRNWVNLAFKSKFGFKVLKPDEKSTHNISKPCENENDFDNRIGSVNNLIDLMDKEKLLSNIETEVGNEIRSISALEQFLKSTTGNEYNKGIIEKLRTLKKLRKKVPFHLDSEIFYKTVKSLGITHPINWSDLWEISLSLYLDSLKLLQEQIENPEH